MRWCVVVFAGTLASLVVGPSSAGAQSPYSYRWCAYYSPAESGLTSCYFTTYEQCMASVSGVGGYCGLNPMYRGPDQAPAPGHPRRHHRHH